MKVYLGFSVEGLIIFLLPIVINIFYVLFPPWEIEKKEEVKMPVLECIEKVTRIAYAGVICILVNDKDIDYTSVYLYISVMFLVLYYIVWIRYYIGGRKISLLSAKFLGIPIPLAVFPVLYFIFAALWLHNYVALIIMFIFGIAHNIISYCNLYKKE